ncbi:hypothetical protein C1645_817502 [Glomus cerebriforme]|uniref:Uncharacterized protein n=1 Tax=Glomus cerebriforme TaxID=658196 RepID=A0A397TAA3_9GLOM|nr:hypothetical protein C1645_817502 [Glomus cerebriforme]
MSVMPSGSNNSRIIILEDRIKEINLSEEERAAFRKAKSQVQNHSRLGALAGTLTGAYFSRIKKYSLGLSLAICFGSMTLGSQIGFVTGTAAGIRTIKSLPNSQRIFEEIKRAHLKQNIPPPRKNQEQRDDDDQSSTLLDEFTPDNQDLTNNENEQQSSWAKYRSPQTPSRRQQQQSSSQQDDNNNDSSSWDNIKAENSGLSTWDKIRQKNKIAQQQQNPTFDGESSNEIIPRTREDFEELYGEGKIKTNKYGDIEIINK